MAAEELEPHSEREEPLLGAVVQVALEPPPLLVAGADDPGARLAKLVELGSELGLEPCVLEGQSCGGTGGLEERRLVDEVELVDDDGEPVADVRGVPSLAGRQVEPLALLVDPGLAIGKPEADLERGVADGTGERVAHLPRLHVIELHDEVAHVGASALHEEEPGQADHAEGDVRHEDNRVLLQ
jgi:hypothetical protein